MKRRFFIRIISILLILSILGGSALTATAYDKLKHGDSGADVLSMQNALKSLGFSINPDGKYGDETERVVRDFQRKYRLDTDGIAGNKTLTLLYQLAPAYAPGTGGNSSVNPPASKPTQTIPPSSNTRLERGSEGTAVVELQTMLNKLGYSISTDGKYGYATYLAVRSFQAKHHLTTDGIAGAQTLSLLRSLTSSGAAVPTATPPQTGRTKLQRGDEGADVLLLQQMLSKIGYDIKTDGKFGDTTYLCVRDFQLKYRLTADGIAGAQTLALLRTLASATTTPTVTPTPVPTLAPVVTVPPATSTPYIRLERGNEGADVVELQTMLVKLGYSLSIDGKFGYSTYLIVRSFQSRHNLNADGIAGVQTMALLRSLTGATATATATTAATQAPTSAPTASVHSSLAVVTTSGGILYFRATPNKNGAVLDKIPNRTQVIVIERGAIWTTIRYNGVIGYVMSSFLTFLSDTVPTATPTPPAASTPGSSMPVIRSARVIGGKLCLRSQPSKSSAAKLYIPDGAYLTVQSEGATWSAVTYEGLPGYVMTKYIEFFAVPAPTATPDPTVVPSAPVSPSESPSSSPTIAPTPTAPYDSTLLSRSLSAGMTGDDVKFVQTRLSALNYLSSGAVSGTYDTATVAAVRAFQRIHGLGTDGIAGKQTFTALFSESASPYSEASDSYSTLHIYYRSASPDLVDDIERMQSRLAALGYSAKVTGKFDETTYMAVLAFQLRNGLTVDGVGSVAMQNKLFSSSAAPASASPSFSLEDGAGKASAPSASSIKLLHWFDDIKPSLSAGNQLVIYDPVSGLSWTLRLYAAGNHADSEPYTLRDTLIMFEAFGKPSWTTRGVYVKLPNGQWTIASMHNHPHLTGSIKANGFDGHLCVHFLRDMDECQAHDPDYGVTNQKTIRSLWKRMTGETIED